ncbi:MAG: chemotaxis protein CheD [Granulosicoccus sp.]
MKLKLINVHIGEVKTGSGEQQLHTILGSCIGIALLWPKRGVYGLAHCLLPNAPEKIILEMTSGKRRKKQEVYAGRYVDQAIESLTQAMSITNYRDIRAVVAGGANMTLPNANEPEKQIGRQNAISALQCLDERKIIVVHQDTGGHEGRKMSIKCDSGFYEVKAIPRIAA